MHRAGIVCLLTLAGLWPRTALAADAAGCTLKLVNTVPITMAANGTRVLVPVTINGTEKTFLLDTGGAVTQITASAARELKLPITESGGKLLDLYGGASGGAAKVDDFTLGRLHDKHATLIISTFDGESLYAGLLAADYMGKYDIELDFAGGKMNYFSRDHCKGRVVYWPAAAIAVVPMLLRDNHVNLDVTLDGHTFKAIIDTGAPNTTLTTAEAKRVFGITADMPGDKQIYEDRGEKAFEHVFQKLSFEGLEVGRPHIEVIPDKTGSRDANNDYVTGSRVHRVDDSDPSDPVMLIGMNILSKLRLYIAFDEQKIYITPASRP
ncbi:MAG TPA: aspartyl protease family protein [Rhizomicrobium sp.]|nr:aspartyl protease family protein [Rhizomicrobium sp.]